MVAIGNVVRDLKIQKRAPVPSRPLKSNNFLWNPHGLIFNLHKKNLVIIRLNNARAKTSSAIGTLSPIAFTQTVIKLNAMPLPIKYLYPRMTFFLFKSFGNVFLFNSE